MCMKLFKMSRLDTILLSDPAIIGAPSTLIQSNRTLCVCMKVDPYSN